MSKEKLLKEILNRFGKPGKDLDKEFYELDIHAVQRYIERTSADYREALKTFILLENLTSQIPAGHWVYLYDGTTLLGGFPIRKDGTPRTFLLEGMEVDGIMVVDGKIFLNEKRVKKLPKPEYWKWVPVENSKDPKRRGRWVKIKSPGR